MTFDDQARSPDPPGENLPAGDERATAPAGVPADGPTADDGRASYAPTEVAAWADGEGPGAPASGVEAVPPVRARQPVPVRWAIALGATVVVVAAALALVLVAQRPSSSPVLGYVPANAIAYAEARLDTPGDQGQALASVLSNFPGFADTSNLQVKLSDTWDRLVAGMTGNRYTYSADVAPWAEGTVGLAVLPGPAGGQPQTVVLAAVKDQAKAQAEVDRIAGQSATTTPATQVGGVTVHTLDAGTATFALLPSGMFVIASDAAAIGSVEDAQAGRTPALASSQAYADTSSGAAPDRLGSVYVSTASLQSQLHSLVPSISPAVASCPGGATDPLAAIPPSMFGTLRAESDRAVAEFRIRPAPGGTVPQAHESALVDHVPGTTLAYVELHGVGATLAGTICGLKAGLGAVSSQAPSASSAATDQQLQQIEGILGGPLESFVSWMGDAGIVVGAPASGASTPSVAFVATATDVPLATQRLSQLKGLIQMAGAFGGTPGLSVAETQHGSATITTLTIPTGELAGSSVPAPVPASTTVSFALADGRFVLALSPDQVGTILDVSQAQSLGATPAFRDALASAGGPAVTTLAYVDLQAARAAIESAATPPANYQTDVKPYLLPLDRLVMVGGVDGGTPTLELVVTVTGTR